MEVYIVFGVLVIKYLVLTNNLYIYKQTMSTWQPHASQDIFKLHLYNPNIERPNLRSTMARPRIGGRAPQFIVFIGLNKWEACYTRIKSPMTLKIIGLCFTLCLTLATLINWKIKIWQIAIIKLFNQQFVSMISNVVT